MNDTTDREANAQLARASIGAASLYSSLTGRTTFSQDEIHSLDADAILGGLVDLDSQAESILNYVTPLDADLSTLQGNADNLLDESSSYRRRLVGRLRAFNALQASFGQHTFINPEHILRFLLGVPNNAELLPAIWRPDDVFYKANLVILLQTLFQDRKPEHMFDGLQTLDTQFPSFAFKALQSSDAQGLLVGESQDAVRAFVAAVELRTQLFVYALLQNPTEDSIEPTFTSLFFADEEDAHVDFPVQGELVHLRPFDDALDGADRYNLYKEAADRIVAIQQIIAKHSESADATIDALKQSFPWSDCALVILDWVQGRYRELRESTQDRGGAAKIVEYLEREIHQTESNTDPQLLRTMIEADIASGQVPPKRYANHRSGSHS